MNYDEQNAQSNPKFEKPCKIVWSVDSFYEDLTEGGKSYIHSTSSISFSLILALLQEFESSNLPPSHFVLFLI